MVEYGFNTIVAIQAVDTTDNTVVNLCMSMAIDNSRGIVLLNKETVCDYICLILCEVTKEEIMGALNKVLIPSQKQDNLLIFYLLFLLEFF